MSVHRRCCCSPSAPCDPGWEGSCGTVMKVSVLAMNAIRRVTLCSDAGTGSSGCTDLEGFEFNESYDSALTDIEFELEASSPGVYERYVVRPAASNGGTLDVSLSCGTETVNIQTATSFSFPDGCTYTCTDLSIGGTGSKTCVLSAPGDGNVVEALTGTIRVDRIGETECLARLNLFIRMSFDEFYDHNYITKTGDDFCGPVFAAGNVAESAGVVISIEASATYTLGECPSDATWTLDSASSYLLFNGEIAPGYIGCDLPETLLATLCPVGTVADCSTPSDCLSPSGDANAWKYFKITGSPTVTWGQDIGWFHTLTVDTPTVSVAT